MKIYPAIDLRNQKSVRLQQGDYDQETQYGTPLDLAMKWIKQGASNLHVVDLDAARGSNSNNLQVIEELTQQVNVPIQVGGGVRSIERIELLLNIGVSRVILGTKAVNDLDFLKEALKKYGPKLVVSVDARNGYVATDGWMKTSSVKAIDFIKQIEQLGVQTLVYTDISKDGMLQGANLDELELIQQETSINVIASGGVSTMEDIQALKDMNIYGAIIGKALYEGRLQLKDVLEVSHVS